MWGPCKSSSIARNILTWNGLIAGYAEHGLGDEALSYFGWMQDEGLSPDSITFVCLLQACGSIGAAEKGEEIHAKVDRQGLLGKNIVIGTALVDMYGKCGELLKAQEVFEAPCMGCSHMDCANSWICLSRAW